MESAAAWGCAVMELTATWVCAAMELAAAWVELLCALEIELEFIFILNVRTLSPLTDEMVSSDLLAEIIASGFVTFVLVATLVLGGFVLKEAAGYI